MAPFPSELPVPLQGLVIRYAYLWHSDEARGLSDSGKDRPCAIVMASSATGRVAVVPTTHAPPELGEEAHSIKIPPEICAEIGLDDDDNWVRVRELNVFQWPGPHLRPLPRDPARVDYGMIPKAFFETIRDRIVALIRDSRVAQTRR